MRRSISQQVRRGPNISSLWLLPSGGRKLAGRWDEGGGVRLESEENASAQTQWKGWDQKSGMGHRAKVVSCQRVWEVVAANHLQIKKKIAQHHTASTYRHLGAEKQKINKNSNINKHKTKSSGLDYRCLCPSLPGPQVSLLVSARGFRGNADIGH